jgi:hypothetical protein
MRPRGGEFTGFIETIFAKNLAGGKPVDLLPGEMAIQSVSTSKEIYGWFADGELAYHEHKGLGVQQLFLLNVEQRQLFTQDKLIATWFAWSESGECVAGQQPLSFWLWDRKERRFLTPKRLPGNQQRFEAWSPDGRSVLFTAWDRNEGYGQPGARPTLYRLSVESGDVEKVDENAGLAALSGDLMAYVKFGERLTLVVAKASGGQVLWTDDLGELSKVEAKLPWGDQPTIASTFVGYRTVDDEWRVSPHVRKESRLMFRGPATTAQWSPFGRYLAVHKWHGNEAHLQVLENPLA